MWSFFELGRSSEQDKVDAIIFTVQASKPRLTANQRYIWGRIRSIFGGDIGENLLIAATFADAGEAQVVASIRSSGVDFVKSLKLNNCALFAPNSGNRRDYKLSVMQWDHARDEYGQLLAEVSRLERRTIVRTRQYTDEEMMWFHVLQGIRLEIAELIVDFERTRQQIEFVKAHSTQISWTTNLCFPVRLFRPIVLPSDGIACCPFCGVTSDSLRFSGSVRVCPIDGHPLCEVTAPFTFHYSEEIKYCTTGQLVSHYFGSLDTRKNLAVRLLSVLHYKEDSVQTKLARKLQQKIDIAAPFLKCDCRAMLLAAEEKIFEPGRAERLRCLNTILVRMTRESGRTHQTRQ
jgi:hypothetical protein